MRDNSILKNHILIFSGALLLLVDLFFISLFFLGASSSGGGNYFSGASISQYILFLMAFVAALLTTLKGIKPLKFGNVYILVFVLMLAYLIMLILTSQ